MFDAIRNTNPRLCPVASLQTLKHCTKSAGGYLKWHATQCPSAEAFSGGATVVQTFLSAIGQRVWRWQPVGEFSGLGTSPLSMMRLRRTVGSGIGTADSSASV